MSGANHIAGGTVFTGIYLSMWDINIFSHPLFLFFTALFSVLPDVDHTKSPIGKVCYPIAKYLDRKFGHRTITHSLFFYITGILLTGLIERIVLEKSGIYTSIFIWAYGSHLVFDMMTKQGIPLFFPFKKNPCVIPGNPDYRFRASDFKTESIIFAIFLGFGFTCKPLFANGFWNSYNKTFSNAQHIGNEIKLTDKIVKVSYEFQRLGNTKKGTGYAISAGEKQILLFDNGFIKIDETADRVKKLEPIRTNQIIKEESIYFSNISFDSLQAVIQNKPILSLKIQGTLPISFTKENKPQSAQNLELEYVFNPVLKSENIDSLDASIQREIALTKLDISKATQANNLWHQQKAATIQRFTRLRDDLNSEDLAAREYATKEFPRAKTEVESLREPINEIPALQEKIKFLNSKLHIQQNQSINGYISYFLIK